MSPCYVLQFQKDVEAVVVGGGGGGAYFFASFKPYTMDSFPPFSSDKGLRFCVNHKRSNLYNGTTM